MVPFLSLTTVALVLFGFLTGLGGYTFVQGQGHSYFSDNPKACVNCHIMKDQFASWQRSTHHNFTTCNSCHAPDHPVLALLYKAENGFMHSYKFTTGVHTDPIEIRPHNKRVALNACLNCHQQLFAGHPQTPERSCLDCHHNVGHPHSRGR